VKPGYLDRERCWIGDKWDFEGFGKSWSTAPTWMNEVKDQKQPLQCAAIYLGGRARRGEGWPPRQSPRAGIGVGFNAGVFQYIRVNVERADLLRSMSQVGLDNVIAALTADPELSADFRVGPVRRSLPTEVPVQLAEASESKSRSSDTADTRPTLNRVIVACRK